MSNNLKIAKQEVLPLLNLQSTEELDSLLLQLAESLRAQNKKPSDDITNPQTHESISRKSLGLLRDFIQQPQTAALPPSPELQPEAAPEVEETETLDNEPAPLTKVEENTLVQPPISSEIEYTNQVLRGTNETLIALRETQGELAGIEAAASYLNAYDRGFRSQIEARYQSSLSAIATDLESSVGRIQKSTTDHQTFKSESLGKFNQSSETALTNAQALLVRAKKVTTQAKDGSESSLL